MTLSISRFVIRCGVIAATLLCSPLAAQADLIFSPEVAAVFPTYEEAASSTNDNISGYTLDSTLHDNISSFPASNTLVGPFATSAYSYTQSGGVTHLDLLVSEQIPAGNSNASFYNVVGKQQTQYAFIPTVDETYSWASSWIESGTTAAASQEVSLREFARFNFMGMDVYNDNGLIFSETRGRLTRDGIPQFTDTITGSPTGMLTAGNIYILRSSLALQNSNPQFPGLGLPEFTYPNAPGTASGEFHFTAIPMAVPEASSRLLGTFGTVALGACRWSLRPIRGRRQ